MKSLLTIILLGYATLVFSQKVNNSHPRIYNSDASKSAAIASFDKVPWKKEFIERKKQEVAKYIQLCEQDSTWLVSRLQMNWKTRHSNVYLQGGNFSHSDGESPVPTVRYSGTRDWATDYKKPTLEEIKPYFDDERGYFLEHKDTGKKEWVHPSKTGHMIEGINQRILGIVENAAFLYWLTGEEQYAKLATPIFFTYINGMHHRNPPEVLDESNQRFVSGLATFEVIHEKAVQQLVISYDYLYNYFVEQQHDLGNTAAVFQKWGDQIIKLGIPDNNWNLFQARFLTYIALALENDDHYENGKGQQYYLKYTFDVSTPRQIAIKEALLVYDQETGIWPESPSYSMHVNTTLLEILALLDNVSNNNELTNFPIIEKAALACFQYLFPSGNNVGFGDSKHSTIPFENFELLISNYQKYKKQDQAQLMTSLLAPFIEDGIYKRRAKNLLQLNYYVDELPDISSTEKGGVSQLTTPTFYAPNVSMFIQRLGTGDKAMMVSTVGSYGNHTHANGISMEIFANNYVHAPDMGRGKSYWSPDFREYYSQMPAHNTVVVDGKSTYPNMRSYNPFSLENHFPKSGTLNPLFSKVTYGNFSFIEPKTSASQQRLTAMINTASGEGYVLDIFRSKKQEDGAQKHEYFYHNLGHSLEFFDADDKLLTLAKTEELTSKNGELKAYDYLTEKQTLSYSGDTKAIFKIEENAQPDNVMQVWIKGHENQTLFSVKSPKSNALSKGTAPESLIDQEMPTLILRRNEAAWNDPFVLVFNPYMEGNNPVEQVDFSAILENPNCQKITVQHTDGITYDHIAVATSANDVVTEDDFYQKGLLSIIRTKEDASDIDFLFASGVYQIKYKEWEILAVRTEATVSVEKQADGFWVENDAPVIIKAPITADFKPAIIHLYNEDGSREERMGHINRSNPNQIEFRLTQAYEKAVIISEQSNGQ